jgi:hypothetical protein
MCLPATHKIFTWSEVEYFAFLIFGTKFSPTPVETSPEAEARVEDEDETEGRDGVEAEVLAWLE